ncbi:hypothetical protein, partial [Streptomyces sp. WELS2]|uniref:hypothetical protein n=1 Tax=Streptomyces sp. WELS2 TaxID=2749435 RepID=UPI001C693004
AAPPIARAEAVAVADTIGVRPPAAHRTPRLRHQPPSARRWDDCGNDRSRSGVHGRATRPLP